MKRISLTLEDIFMMPSAEIFDPDSMRTIYSVTIDSRKVKRNALFVAIKGERFDGHTFVKGAESGGASAAVIERSRLREYDKVSIPLIAVDDTTAAYGYLASLWRKKLKAKVISLTGSNGKTTTKDALVSLFAAQFRTKGTDANNNNQLGVPLTIFSANLSDERLVLEHGTNHFGEIAYTAEIAKSDIALITNIGLSHIEFLKNKRGVLREKKSLFDFTESSGGTVLLNIDDPMLRGLREKYTRCITFGFHEDADIRGRLNGYNDRGFAEMEVVSRFMKLSFTAPLAGRHNAANMLAAVAAAITGGVKKENIYKGLKKIRPPKGRLQIRREKRFTIIDDTYNANVESMKSAFALASEIHERTGKIAILGDMFELGEKSEELHRSLAKPLRESGFDEVYLIGKHMRALAETLRGKEIVVKYYRSRKQLAARCAKLSLDDALILIKGSRGMKMEEFVEIIEKES